MWSETRGGFGWFQKGTVVSAHKSQRESRVFETRRDVNQNSNQGGGGYFFGSFAHLNTIDCKKLHVRRNPESQISLPCELRTSIMFEFVLETGPPPPKKKSLQWIIYHRNSLQRRKQLGITDNTLKKWITDSELQNKFLSGFQVWFWRVRLDQNLMSDWPSVFLESSTRFYFIPLDSPES